MYAVLQTCSYANLTPTNKATKFASLTNKEFILGLNGEEKGLYKFKM